MVYPSCAGLSRLSWKRGRWTRTTTTNILCLWWDGTGVEKLA